MPVTKEEILAVIEETDERLIESAIELINVWEQCGNVFVMEYEPKNDGYDGPQIFGEKNWIRVYFYIYHIEVSMEIYENKIVVNLDQTSYYDLEYEIGMINYAEIVTHLQDLEKCYRRKK